LEVGTVWDGNMTYAFTELAFSLGSEQPLLEMAAFGRAKPC